MRRKIKHPEHPCMVCREITTNLSYCDLHEAFAVRMGVYPAANKFSITSDRTYSKVHKRNESVDRMR